MDHLDKETNNPKQYPNEPFEEIIYINHLDRNNERRKSNLITLHFYPKKKT